MLPRVFPSVVLVVDDNPEFATRVSRALGRALEFGGGPPSSADVRSRIISEDGAIVVEWVEPTVDGALDYYRARLIELKKCGHDVWTVLDVAGFGTNGPDFRAFHKIFLDSGGDARRLWVVSSYLVRVEEAPQDPDNNGLIRVRPKSPETLHDLRRKIVPPPETCAGADAADHIHILVTGAGFEMAGHAWEGLRLGMPATAELVKQMRYSPPAGRNLPGFEPQYHQDNEKNVGLPYDTRAMSSMRDTAETGDLDEYWQELLQGMSAGAQPATGASDADVIFRQDYDLRDAFRRSLLKYDFGHLWQSIAASELPWLLWLSTNYTRFADRAIVQTNDHLPRGAARRAQRWRIIGTPEDSRLARREGLRKLVEHSRVLVKLHGDIGHVKTMALAASDKDTRRLPSVGVQPELDEMYEVAIRMAVLGIHQRVGEAARAAAALEADAAVATVGAKAQAGSVTEQAPALTCHWHVVGHGLQDKPLVDLMRQVMLQTSPHHHHVTIVCPGATPSHCSALKSDLAIPGNRLTIVPADTTATEYMVRYHTMVHAGTAEAPAPLPISTPPPQPSATKLLGSPAEDSTTRPL